MDGSKVKWDKYNECRVAGLLLAVSHSCNEYRGMACIRHTRREAAVRRGRWRKSEELAKADAERLAKDLVKDTYLAVLDMSRALDVDLADFGRMATEWTGPR